jgi:predicted ATPase
MRERLNSIRITNFKSIRDSGSINLTPLTVLIGSNGSGKSSLVEGLLTFKVMSEEGLSAAMKLWRGVQHTCHHDATPPAVCLERGARKWAMSFEINGRSEGGTYRSHTDLQPSQNHDTIKVWRDVWRMPGGATKIWRHPEIRRSWGETLNETVNHIDPQASTAPLEYMARLHDRPMMSESGMTTRWQFLHLVPERIMPPVPRSQTDGRVVLSPTGENLAEYLDEIRTLNLGAFEAIQEAMKAILPYVSDVRAEAASLVEKTLYLALNDGSLKAGQERQPSPIPGWMMSTGTLRALAILAVLRHPEPPTLLVVEEIENSLDPRTLALLMDEIRRAVRSGRTQVILTTHSPLLLDMVLLKHIIFVDRPPGSPPRFRRLDQSEQVKEWAESFSPGQMLTTGLFRQLL